VTTLFKESLPDLRVTRPNLVKRSTAVFILHNIYIKKQKLIKLKLRAE